MSSIHFLLGKTLGRYEIVAHIGHGGMAEVYLGQQVNLDRHVAIKVLHPFLADEVGFVTRFQREAQLVATLRHPNIVQVYDFDYDEEYEVYYMVMEYIQGATLKDRLQNDGITLENGVFITAGVADALHYAHQRDMVHRDVKPANIMFTEEGHPVLADFGIARMLSVSGLTASGAMVGTPAYMAPEIGMGEPATASADIYSLGVVLYQLVTGRLPFEAEVPMSLVMKHINDPVPPPTKFVPDMPAELETVILTALRKQPQERFATAGEMAVALRQALGLEQPSYSARGASVENDQHAPGLSWKSAAEASAVDEIHEPLLRSWTIVNQPTEQEQAAGEGEGTRSSVIWRLLRTLLLIVCCLAIGIGIWQWSGGETPVVLVEFLASRGISTDFIATQTPTVTPAPTATPESLVVGTPTVANPPPITPTVALTDTGATLYSYRAKVLRLYTTPNAKAVPPGTDILVYITLSNGGENPWPAGMQLAFVSGVELSATTALPLEALSAGGQVQVLLPLRAPRETGTYKSIWEVQRPNGESASSRISLEVVVKDLPTVTSTPPVLEEETVTPTPQTALNMETPQLLNWEVDEEQESWSGTLTFAATGGTGVYHFYRDTIREDTELREARLEFSWRQCIAMPLKIILVSGEETLVWEEQIPYPAPEQCGQ